MQQFLSFLKLIRIGNLFIMLATLIFTRFCLNDYLLIPDLLDVNFFYLILATLLTGAAGNIINDYYDMNLDLVNKPDKVIVGKVFSKRITMLIYLSFSSAAIIFGLLINIKIATFILLCMILLWLYSFNFKKQFLIGNIIVATMSAFVIFILKIFDHTTPTTLIFLYSAFAFFISILREIIKDIEDIKGDKYFNCKTLPIVLGIIKTKKILIVTSLIFISLLTGIVFFTSDFIKFQHSETELFYKFYLFSFVIIPLTAIIFLIKKAKIKKDFSRLSLLIKLIMLSGILSMIFLRF